MNPTQDLSTLPFTPEWSTRIRQLAERGDPFFQGAAWVLHTMNDQHQPPETPGASSRHRKDAP